MSELVERETPPEFAVRTSKWQHAVLLLVATRLALTVAAMVGVALRGDQLDLDLA